MRTKTSSTSWGIETAAMYENDNTCRIPREVAELKTDDEWLEAVPVLRCFRPEATVGRIISLKPALTANGYKLFGLRVEQQLVTVAGIHIYPHLTNGNMLWINDLVTRDGERSKGHGRAMMAFLESYAAAEECTFVYLHTYFGNKRGQAFYREKRGFAEYALVFRKSLI